MSHCINVILIKRSELEGKKIPDIIKTKELPQDILAFPTLEKSDVGALFGEGVKFIHLTTDYFGGCGEQFSRMFITNETGYTAVKKYSGMKPINESLKDYGVVCDGDDDEFDTITLGRYRGNDDFE